MVDENGGALKTIVWSEICPWLAIFRTFRIAISFRVLLLGAAGVLLTALAWCLIALVFLPKLEPAAPQAAVEEAAGADPAAPEATPPAAAPSQRAPSPATEWLRPFAVCPWVVVTDELVDDKPGLPQPDRFGLISPASNPFVAVWATLTEPLMRGFRAIGIADLACLLLCGLTSLAIWAYFGGAITRIAAVQLAGEERVSLAAAARHACRKWPAYFVGPLIPLLGIACAAVPVYLCALILMNFDVGVLLASFVWPLLLIFGLIMALLLLGLIFGWPLMWATISTEGTDSFDALSRSYAYVFQRPLHYLFYAIVAALLGVLGWLLVSNFAAAVIGVTYWAAAFGCGAKDIEPIMELSKDLSGPAYAGAVVIHVWNGCIKLLAVGFVFGYFWSAMSAIYLLLRRDVDATEMDEVYLDEDASEQAYGLPPMKTDESGAPVVDDTPTEPTAEDEPSADDQPQEEA